MEKSLIDYAYDFVSKCKDAVSFNEIWNYVKNASGLDEEAANARISKFYTNLMLDGRFVTLGDNRWDLRVRQTFEKVHIDMRDVYSDVETSDIDSEEADEEKEYNEAFEEPKEDDGDGIEPEEGSEEENTL